MAYEPRSGSSSMNRFKMRVKPGRMPTYGMAPMGKFVAPPAPVRRKTAWGRVRSMPVVLQ
jgi:hypothetical protein